MKAEIEVQKSGEDSLNVYDGEMNVWEVWSVLERRKAQCEFVQPTGQGQMVRTSWVWEWRWLGVVLQRYGGGGCEMCWQGIKICWECVKDDMKIYWSAAWVNNIQGYVEGFDMGQSPALAWGARNSRFKNEWWWRQRRREVDGDDDDYDDDDGDDGEDDDDGEDEDNDDDELTMTFLGLWNYYYIWLGCNYNNNTHKQLWHFVSNMCLIVIRKRSLQQNIWNMFHSFEIQVLVEECLSKHCFLDVER